MLFYFVVGLFTCIQYEHTSSPPLLLTYFHRIPHRLSDTFALLHSSSEPIAIVSNTSPIPTHIYITHHVHCSSFSTFASFLTEFSSYSLRNCLPYTFVVPLRHLLPHSVFTNSPLFAYNVGLFPGFVHPALLPHPCLTPLVFFMMSLFVWFTSFRFSSIKFLIITNACTVFSPFLPAKIISYASVTTTSNPLRAIPSKRLYLASVKSPETRLPISGRLLLNDTRPSSVVHLSGADSISNREAHLAGSRARAKSASLCAMDPPNPNPNLSALIDPRKHRHCDPSNQLIRPPAPQDSTRQQDN